MLEDLTIKEWQLIYFVITSALLTFNITLLLSIGSVMNRVFHESELVKLLRNEPSSKE